MTSADLPESGPAVSEQPSLPRWAEALQDVGRLFVQPGRLFADLPRRNHATFVLFLLLLAYVGYGAALLSTGVPDYEVDWTTEQSLRSYDRKPVEADRTGRVDKGYLAYEKMGIFSKHMLRVQYFVGAPLRVLTLIGLFGGLLFMMVALRGGKPNFKLLSGIVIFAWLVELPRLAVRVWLVSQLQTTRVDTSLAAFVHSTKGHVGTYLALRRLDPFDLWFWGLVWLGMVKTGQLTPRAGFILVGLLALLAAVVQCAFEMPGLIEY